MAWLESLAQWKIIRDISTLGNKSLLKQIKIIIEIRVIGIASRD